MPKLVLDMIGVGFIGCVITSSVIGVMLNKPIPSEVAFVLIIALGVQSLAYLSGSKAHKYSQYWRLKREEDDPKIWLKLLRLQELGAIRYSTDQVWVWVWTDNQNQVLNPMPLDVFTPEMYAETYM